MKKQALISFLMVAFAAGAQAAPVDVSSTINGQIKISKEQPGVDIWVLCSLHDKNNQILFSAGSNKLGSIGQDGTFNGAFSVGMKIPAATFANIGPKISVWRCYATRSQPNLDPNGKNDFFGPDGSAEQAANHLQGNLQ
jgi:hypothetical protein